MIHLKVEVGTPFMNALELCIRLKVLLYNIGASTRFELQTENCAEIEGRCQTHGNKLKTISSGQDNTNFKYWNQDQ